MKQKETILSNEIVVQGIDINITVKEVHRKGGYRQESWDGYGVYLTLTDPKTGVSDSHSATIRESRIGTPDKSPEKDGIMQRILTLIFGSRGKEKMKFSTFVMNEIENAIDEMSVGEDSDETNKNDIKIQTESALKALE